MKFLWIVLAGVCLVGCQKTTIAHKDIAGSDFIQLDNTPFTRMVVSDKADFSKYDRIVFGQLKFDRLEITSSGRAAIDRTWKLNDEDKKIYSGYFLDEIAKVFGGANALKEFGLGSGLNEHTLRAEFRLMKFRPATAKHGENVSGTIGRQSTSSFGTLFIQILLVDSLTNEFVAAIEDGKVLETSRLAAPLINPTNDAQAWKRTFEDWLQELKETAIRLKSDSQPKT